MPRKNTLIILYVFSDMLPIIIGSSIQLQINFRHYKVYDIFQYTYGDNEGDEANQKRAAEIEAQGRLRINAIQLFT